MTPSEHSQLKGLDDLKTGNARKALEAKTGKKVVSKTNYLVAPTPGLLDAPEPAAPSKPKVRVKPKLQKGA